MGSYRDLRVWQQAMKLALLVYKATEAFPKSEVYGLSSQMRRAAVSIACNIAEGKGRNTDRDFRNFLFHARGSLLELEIQMTLAQELRFLKEEQGMELLKKTAALGSGLTGLINSLKPEAAAASAS